MTNEADALLREALAALDPAKDQALRERIGRYLAGQRSYPDTSKVAQDLTTVVSGPHGFAVDQAMRRLKDLAKP